MMMMLSKEILRAVVRNGRRRNDAFVENGKKTTDTSSTITTALEDAVENVRVFLFLFLFESFFGGLRHIIGEREKIRDDKTKKKTRLRRRPQYARRRDRSRRSFSRETRERGNVLFETVVFR